MRYLSLADTEQLDLRMAEIVPAVERAFQMVGLGQAIVVPRVRLVHPPVPEGSFGQGRSWERDLRVITGGLSGIGFGVRLGGSLRRKAGGVLLLLFDWETMEIKALISDHLVHGVRSAVPAGVLAKYLALEETPTMALIGSGRLARWAAEAVCVVRSIRDLRIWSPNPASRAACVQYLKSRLDAGTNISAAAGAEEAVRGAEIVVTATKTLEPVLKGEWLAPGATVITHTPEELDLETLRRGKIVTTYREGVLGHVPPYHSIMELLAKGELSPADLSVDLGDVVVGRAPGRTTSDEIIACINPAFGVLDAVTAEYVFQKAVSLGVGLELPA